MIRHGLLAATCLLLGACSNSTFHYPEESELLKTPVSSAHGFPVPDSPPVREPWTTYFEVKSGGSIVGYVVRFDEPPIGTYAPNRPATGTLFVEDEEFQRIGFVTHAGKAFRFRGREPEEIGTATIEDHLPAYFGKRGLKLEPMAK